MNNAFWGVYMIAAMVVVIAAIARDGLVGLIAGHPSLLSRWWHLAGRATAPGMRRVGSRDRPSGASHARLTTASRS